MNTLKEVSLTLVLAIIVLAGCQPIGTPGPETVISDHNEHFRGTWTVQEVKKCPDFAGYGEREQHPYIRIPEKGDKYKIIHTKGDKFAIRAVKGDAMKDWEELELTYKPGDIQKRPNGPEFLEGNALPCKVPSVFADRLHGCIPKKGMANCINIELVKESPLHPGEAWSPFIVYSDAYLHNGIIH